MTVNENPKQFFHKVYSKTIDNSKNDFMASIEQSVTISRSVSLTTAITIDLSILSKFRHVIHYVQMHYLLF